jgi:hypothetical protein
LSRPSTACFLPKDVDARYIRAFTPVFRQAMAGHDSPLQSHVIAFRHTPSFSRRN